MIDTHPQFEQFVDAIVRIPFNQLLGLKLEKIDTHEAVMHFDMKKELIGNFLHGILHGGVISAVLDMAGGMVVMANAIHKNADKTLEEITTMLGKCSTVDLQVSYLAPGRGERFHAQAEIIKSGSKLSFTRMSLYNHEKTLIASASATYMLR